MRKRVPGVGDLDRLAPARLVAGEVGARDDAAALVDQREQRLARSTRVDARGALLGERLERRDEARLLEQLAGLAAAGRPGA